MGKRFKRMSLDELSSKFEVVSEGECQTIVGGCSGCDKARSEGKAVYTLAEAESLMDAGNWHGGYVCGYGDLLLEVSTYSDGPNYGAFCFTHDIYYPYNKDCPSCGDPYGGYGYGDGSGAVNPDNNDNGPVISGGSGSGSGGASYSPATISWGNNADSSVISVKTKNVLAKLTTLANDKTITITSTLRTAEDQARVMYDNILKTSVTKQKELYGNYGDSVIDVYSECKNNGITDASIIKQKMMDKINEVGPGNVSKHCGDSKLINVMDIAGSSVSDRVKFETSLAQLQRDGDISKYIVEYNDDKTLRCYHIEIKQ